ncbi:uncharacterized protein LOC108680902 [Hyalella azteca]|uniref:Uncharacterized protein LOC108680902 n=1 Tax=Hyalella azteca TaxID=294128 RepID=A0A8B7PGQ0_HYAAZ|nr:uncharacterized protein LOC108680902 [Hyalella azteca]
MVLMHYREEENFLPVLPLQPLGPQTELWAQQCVPVLPHLYLPWVQCNPCLPHSAFPPFPPTPPLPGLLDDPFLAHRPTLALIHFLQFYCNGLRHCAVELAHFLISHSILIAAIQESKLTEASNPPSFPGYTLDDRMAARGAALLNQIDSSQLVLLNQDIPTRLPSQGAPSSPDLTLISPHLALDAVWTPLAHLNSDHLPISISLDSMNSPNNHPFHTYINLCRADLDGYASETEAAFSTAAPPSSCSQGEVFFRRVCTLAARRHIPRRCRRDFISNLPPSAIPLIQERDRTRALNPNHPSLPDLNNNISAAITTHSRTTKIKKVQSSNLQRNPSKFWLLLHSSGRSTYSTEASSTVIPSQTHPLYSLRIRPDRRYGARVPLLPLAQTPSLSSTSITWDPETSSTLPNFTIFPSLRPTSLPSGVLPLVDSQHGFCPLHSTTSALLPLTQAIATGFNQPRPPTRTIAMAIYFSKAFDTVSHAQLISHITITPLHANITRWLICNIRGQSARCSYNSISSPLPVHAGVPQGSVISPVLFNSYVSDF